MEKAQLIDGKKLAASIIDQLTIEIKELKRQAIIPELQVFLIGDDPVSKSYITQKQKAAETIGARIHVTELPKETTDHEFRTLLLKANDDKQITGIIIQRPLPKESEIKAKTLLLVDPKKDVDGFVPKTRFEVPVARAIFEIIEKVYHDGFDTKTSDFVTWLRQQKIVVIGKGETAGRPIAQLFEKLSLPVFVVDSTTPNPNDTIRNGTIVISCVGKPGIVKREALATGVILISVGLTKVEGKLFGDYNEEEIRSLASYYTPTPGGVGPVNVACLMKNLVEACTIE